jgi:enoyl-CoA hydratase
MGWQFFEIERRDEIAVIRIDRPPANAIDLELAREADQVLEQVLSSDAPAALVFTGTGENFSAGLDLKRVPTYSPEEQRAMITTLNRAGGRLYGSKIPVVGAINGHAIAGGMIFAIACDYRVGPDSDSQFGLTEARAGIPFPAVALTILKAELPPHAVRVLTLLCRNVGPEQAQAMGILDELVPREAVCDRAIEIARDMAAIPPGAYARIKYQMRDEAIEKIEEIVAKGSDPLLDSWIDPNAASASETLLREGGSR